MEEGRNTPCVSVASNSSHNELSTTLEHQPRLGVRTCDTSVSTVLLCHDLSNNCLSVNHPDDVNVEASHSKPGY